jgi:hypothetical protein
VNNGSTAPCPPMKRILPMVSFKANETPDLPYCSKNDDTNIPKHDSKRLTSPERFDFPVSTLNIRFILKWNTVVHDVFLDSSFFPNYFQLYSLDVSCVAGTACGFIHSLKGYRPAPSGSVDDLPHQVETSPESIWYQTPSNRDS